MTKQFLNTLFITTEGAYGNLDNDTVRVTLEREDLLRVPLHHLGCICVIGSAGLSAPLMMRCADDGRSVVFLDRAGRFRARLEGKTTGNVLLRKAQYDWHAQPAKTLSLASWIVAGKVQNSRLVLLRAARDSAKGGVALRDAAERLATLLPQASSATDLDELRGIEGMAAQAYFEVLGEMITAQKNDFRFTDRNRRPPRDRVNALLSFLYSLLTSDCVSALEGVGLDPQFGMLHALRPGRPSLALDLVEEFRSVIADRLCLALINRKQLTGESFDARPGGAVLLNDEGRKAVLIAFQKRKQQTVRHRLLKEPIEIGLLPHLQARLLARVFRGDASAYEPYMPE